MSRRKKNKGKNKPPRLDDLSPKELENRPFAKKLAQMKVQKRAEVRTERERLETESRERKALLEKARAENRTVVGADALRRGDTVSMTDEELFEAALNGLDPVKIDRGKYGGSGPVVKHIARPSEKPVAVAPSNPYNDAEALFAAEFGGAEIKRMKSNLFEREPGALDADKMYRLERAPRDPKAAASRDEAVARMIAEGGPELTVDQRRLLTECGADRGSLPSTNLRGMSRDVALGTLKAAVEHARTHNLRHLRFITGKGLQSAGEPVLKVALVEWCEAMGFRYAPDVFPDGSYGTIIVHIPRRKR